MALAGLNDGQDLPQEFLISIYDDVQAVGQLSSDLIGPTPTPTHYLSRNHVVLLPSWFCKPQNTTFKANVLENALPTFVENNTVKELGLHADNLSLKLFVDTSQVMHKGIV